MDTRRSEFLQGSLFGFAAGAVICLGLLFALESKNPFSKPASVDKPEPEIRVVEKVVEKVVEVEKEVPDTSCINERNLVETMTGFSTMSVQLMPSGNGGRRWSSKTKEHHVYAVIDKHDQIDHLYFTGSGKAIRGHVFRIARFFSTLSKQEYTTAIIEQMNSSTATVTTRVDLSPTWEISLTNLTEDSHLGFAYITRKTKTPPAK